jgi:hypothetical protein
VIRFARLERRKEMDREKAIKDFLADEKIKEEIRKKKQSRREREEEEKKQNISKLLEIAKTKLDWSNGYVYKFDYNEYRYSLCDQDDRTVGGSYLIPKSEMEDEFIRHHEHDVMQNKKLTEAFDYVNICINLPIESAVAKILKYGRKP